MNRIQERNNEELCCICLDQIDLRTINTACVTCRTVMHDTCITELIQNTVNYAYCPHCRSPLPDKFIAHIITRRLNDTPFVTTNMSETELNVEEDLRSFLRWNLVQLGQNVDNLVQPPPTVEQPSVQEEITPEEANRPVPNDPNAINVNGLYWC